MDSTELRFPEGFPVGGGHRRLPDRGRAGRDGKGPSIWDTFSHTPGKTHHGETGDVATDSYHRYPADIEMLKRLGVGAYRFSLSWPRIQADGHGAANSKGLDYYNRVIDALLEAGIEPAVTLYHWDLPQALQDGGGWANRDIAAAFAEFAGIAGEAFGDRVRRWITLNEPWVSANVGYRFGRHAPGLTRRRAGRRRQPPPAARARPRGAGAAVGRARRRRRDHAQPGRGAAGRRRRPRTSRPRSRRATTGCTWGRCSPAATRSG